MFIKQQPQDPNTPKFSTLRATSRVMRFFHIIICIEIVLLVISAVGLFISTIVMVATVDAIYWLMLLSGLAYIPAFILLNYLKRLFDDAANELASRNIVFKETITNLNDRIKKLEAQVNALNVAMISAKEEQND